jgi:hypothetical protein
MFRRWAIPGFLICASLSLALLVLWIQSYAYYERATYDNRVCVAEIVCDWSTVGLCLKPHPPFTFKPALRWDCERQPRSASARLLVNRTLFGFSTGWRTYYWRTPTTPLGASSEFVIMMPLWVPLIPCALLAWLFYGSRKPVERRSLRRVRLRFRPDLSKSNFRLSTRTKRFATFSVVGGVIGLLMAELEIQLHLYRLPQVEMFVPLLPLPLICFLIVMGRRRIPWHRALLWMSLEIAGCICFFVAARERFWHFSGHAPYESPTMLSAALDLGLASFICGAILLLTLQVKPEVAKIGPYCPACGYCLLGTPTQTCPECGRPFTLDELGVSAEALVPTVPSPAGLSK